MNLLLLAESPLLIGFVKDALDDVRDTLLLARDLPSCLQMLKERLHSLRRPDVVLIALHGGAALSMELCRAQEEAEPQGPPLPILVLSPDPEDAEVAQGASAAFLLLPFAKEELQKTLQVLTRERKLILLCDDSTLIHRHTTPILTEAGYDVCAAQDGAEGLELAAEKRPDLVITDIEMPRLDGYTLCRALKARSPHLPVIICSSLGEVNDVEEGFDAGADDYLVKPAQPEELVTRIAMLLGAGRRLPTRERLLVVDDSPAVRHMVTDSLRRQGFYVLGAEDGEAGLRLARAENPAMIVTDYDMPRMTGFEMVHALKRDPATKDIPVMMLTARSSRRDQAQMRAIGLTAYLVKPFSVDKCVAMVERILAERRLKAYKAASQLYISEATLRAAERTADFGESRAEEQSAAVLFSDIRGFTALSSTLPARQVVDLLNSYFDTLCPIIKKQGGDIDKFIGDAIMAVFPAPLSAVRAGLQMQEALRRWNQERGESLEMRIGINTGTVVRGDIGSRHVRLDYTVVGDVVNQAQRHESAAPPGGVLISESTYGAVCGQVRCERQPDVRFKGVAEPARVYLALEVLAADQGEGV